MKNTERLSASCIYTGDHAIGKQRLAWGRQARSTRTAAMTAPALYGIGADLSARTTAEVSLALPFFAASQS
jgi:hypothetical protein